MTEIYKKNLERWSLFSPLEAEFLSQFQGTALEKYTTKNGELNLKNNKNVSFHSEEGAVEESKQWFSSLDLYNINTLFIYGIGLGYYYTALKPWLKENPDSSVIFVEDNAEVVQKFLETPLASEFLADNQARLVFLPAAHILVKGARLLTALPGHFFSGNLQVSALEFYKKEFPKEYEGIPSFINYQKHFYMSSWKEFLAPTESIFLNTYRNVIEIPRSYLATGLVNKFAGVPAIICGAGPSLEKNIHLLKELQDKALIFAGGSSMNVLNHAGIFPHFGLGVDPNWAQVTRLVMNLAFEVPFFYRCRLNNHALQFVHGDKIYVADERSNDMSRYFEEKLGIKGYNMAEGFNVVNFSLAVAVALGCNPIFLVGVDLAYSNDRSYADGVTPHPLHAHMKFFDTKHQSEALIVKTDVNGNPVYTQWKWIAEALWFTNYIVNHPLSLLINCTEGGIGMPGINNMSLEFASKCFLKKQYDLSSRIHGELQDSRMPEDVTYPNVKQLMKKLTMEFKSAGKLCQKLKKEFEKLGIKISKAKKNTSFEISSKAQACLEQLQSKDVYKYLLSNFGKGFMVFYFDSYQKLENPLTFAEKEYHQKKADLNAVLYHFLDHICEINIKVLKEKLLNVKPWKSPKGSKRKQRHKIVASNIEQSADLKKPNTEYYPNGKIKMHQPMHEDILHGLSTFYGPDGNLLASCMYVQGKKEGEATTYYADGGLNSLQRFNQGQREGLQEYYYPDGTEKSFLRYKNDKLHGKIELFYPNGHLHREINFEDSMRHGREMLWSADGIALSEVEYDHGIPIGLAKAWYQNGQLAMEAAYGEGGIQKYLKRWHEDGKIVEESAETNQDYFEQMAKQTEILASNLDKLVNNFLIFVEIAQKTNKQIMMPQEIEAIKSQMENMQKLKTLLLETFVSTKSKGEAIWKTPELQRMMGKQLELATKTMQAGIDEIRAKIALTIEKLK